MIITSQLAAIKQMEEAIISHACAIGERKKEGRVYGGLFRAEKQLTEMVTNMNYYTRRCLNPLYY